MKNTNKYTKIALLIALALILSYIEAILPLSFAIPGLKVGLPNIIIVYALYHLDEKSALMISMVRVVLASLLFTGTITMLYSLSGAVFSFVAMILVKKIKFLSIVSVSVTGALFHNIGQIFMAMLILSNSRVIFYLPYLVFFGIISGIFIGYISALVTERMGKI